MRRVGGEARQHAGGRALLLRQPGGGRAVSRRANDRGFPAAAFARRRRARHRPRPRGDGDVEPACVPGEFALRAQPRKLGAEIQLEEEKTWLGKQSWFATTAAKKSTSRAARRFASPLSDARRGSKAADLCDDCAGKMPGPRRSPAAAAGRRTRRLCRLERKRRPGRPRDPSCGRSTMGRWDSPSSRGLRTRARSRSCWSAIWRAWTTSRR